MNVLRFVGDQKHLHVQFRDTHPHIVAEKVEIGSTDTEVIECENNAFLFLCFNNLHNEMKVSQVKLRAEI